MMAGSALAFADRGFVWKLNLGRAALLQQPPHQSPRDRRKSLHLVAPPVAPEIATGEIAVSHQTKARTLSKREVAQRVSDALQADFGRLAGKHKAIARAAGAASENTAKAWTGRQSLPGLDYFLELGKRSPAIRKMVMRLWNLDPDIDPEYARAFMDLVRAVQRKD